MVKHENIFELNNIFWTFGIIELLCIVSPIVILIDK